MVVKQILVYPSCLHIHISYLYIHICIFIHISTHIRWRMYVLCQEAGTSPCVLTLYDLGKQDAYLWLTSLKHWGGSWHNSTSDQRVWLALRCGCIWLLPPEFPWLKPLSKILRTPVPAPRGWLSFLEDPGLGLPLPSRAPPLEQDEGWFSVSWVEHTLVPLHSGTPEIWSQTTEGCGQGSLWCVSSLETLTFKLCQSHPRRKWPGLNPRWWEEEGVALGNWAAGWEACALKGWYRGKPHRWASLVCALPWKRRAGCGWDSQSCSCHWPHCLGNRQSQAGRTAQGFWSHWAREIQVTDQICSFSSLQLFICFLWALSWMYPNFF